MIIKIDSCTSIRINVINNNEFVDDDEALSRVLMDIAYAYLMSAEKNEADGYSATARDAMKKSQIFRDSSHLLSN